MRFAPPNPLRIADRASGLNALSVRSYNERLVLSLLLQNEGISRMEIGERTGLSAQTVSVIVRSLVQEGLVAKGEAQRGRVGPPTIPLSLNPEGAYAVGIGFSYRWIDIVLIDFVGTVRFHARLPLPALREADAPLLAAVRDAIAVLPVALQARVAGIGLAIPHDVEARESLPDGSLAESGALQGRIEQAVGLPVFLQNDVTATAGAESMFGVAKTLDDYLFFFLGARLRGRLVLNHQIYYGNSDVSFDTGLLRLEAALAAAGRLDGSLWDGDRNWPDGGAAFDAWRRQCRDRLQQSIEGLTQFIELKTVVLASYAPARICQGICDDLTSVLPGVRALASGIGTSPKAVGAASLPFSSRFMVQ